MARGALLLLLVLAGCAAPRPRGTVIGPPIVLPEADLAAIERARLRADWPTLDEWERRSAPPPPAAAPAPAVVIEPRFPAEPYPRVLAVVPGVHDSAFGLAPPPQTGGVPFGAWSPGPPSATGLPLPPHAVGRAPF